MTQEKLKQFLDACFDAKRLIEKLPDLPDGMKPLPETLELLLVGLCTQQ